MKLDLSILDIQTVQFAETTEIRNHILHVNREELRQLLLRDSRIGTVDIEITNPGEKCRILKVANAVEPRAKVGDGGDFPGAYQDCTAAGEGTTCVLRGTAVIECDYAPPNQPANINAMDIIDMWGPGAEMSDLGRTANIVIIPQPAIGTRLEDYHVAAKIAGAKTAAYLARAGTGLKPDSTEVYDLPPVAEAAASLPGLPKVVYIFQLITNQMEPLPGDPILYGGQVDSLLPTILHPNEILDGALLPPRGFFMETYFVQNHPIIKSLYVNHGKTLCFAGVIVTRAPNNADEIDRVATVAANLAKYTLGADGAILTKTGGGAPEVTLGRTAQKCEQLGIKTALALLHMGIDVTDISPKPTTIFNAPEVDAMVSLGAPIGTVSLPPAERVIGPYTGDNGGRSTASGIEVEFRQVKGALSQIGAGKVKAVRY